MIVQACYRKGGSPYTFNVYGAVEVGDLLDDGGQTLVVVAIGSDYKGDVRTVRWVGKPKNREGQTRPEMGGAK